MAQQAAQAPARPRITLSGFTIVFAFHRLTCFQPSTSSNLRFKEKIMSLSSDLTIGRLAAETRCSVPTIRYYEEIGLLPEASRRASGHRVYSAGDLRRLTF